MAVAISISGYDHLRVCDWIAILVEDPHDDHAFGNQFQIQACLLVAANVS